MVKIISSDQVTLDVPKDILMQWTTIKNLFTDLGKDDDVDDSDENAIPISGGNALILEKIIEFYELKDKHEEDETKDWIDAYFELDDVTEKHLEIFDEEGDLIKSEPSIVSVKLRFLFLCVETCSFVDAHILYEEICKKLADNLSGKTPKQIREEWGLPDDLTDEEKEKIKKECAWCMDL